MSQFEGEVWDILYQDWNPLGWNPPASEYVRNVAPLAALLNSGASREQVAAYLHQAAREYDAHPVKGERLEKVLDKLMRLQKP
jgi:hypothetical protein